MPRLLPTSAVLATIALAGCSSNKEPSEANFAAAMTTYFQKKGRLCLGAKDWPVDLPMRRGALDDVLPSTERRQVEALVAAGLVEAQDLDAEEQRRLSGGVANTAEKVTRYTLSASAQPYVQNTIVESVSDGDLALAKHVDLCWGRKGLDKIVRWNGPLTLGDYQVADVTYTYQIYGIADWALRPDVQAAFPSIRRALNGAGSKAFEHSVEMTNEGWEARGLSGW